MNTIYVCYFVYLQKNRQYLLREMIKRVGNFDGPSMDIENIWQFWYLQSKMTYMHLSSTKELYLHNKHT
jgi:hypothetical protein